MPLVQQFDYVRPTTLVKALRALAAHPDSQVLAGGTDLIAWLADDMADPSLLVDIKGIKGLDRIKFTKGEMSLGCLVTFSDLLASSRIRKKAPLVWEMAGKVASPGIRNRATVVGNICSAVPCTDAGTALLVYDAVVDVAGPGGKREIPLDEWFLGPRETSRKPGEIAVGVRFRLPEGRCGACWAKLGRYRGEDLAQASVAVLALENDQYRIAFGAVAPRPIRGREMEERLAGRALSDALIEEVAGMVPATIAPITDIRATKEYRMDMVKVMLERSLRAAAARRAGRPPEYGTSVI
jgi:CO/xanthine dehydrogenase FAD-binding subunit